MNKQDYVNSFYRTGHEEEFIADFYFFEDAYTKFKNGDKKNLKWVILSLHMLLQNLFILSLKSTHPFYVYKNECAHSVNGKKYNFKINFEFNQELFKIEGDTIWLHPYFPFGNSFELILQGLSDEGIMITKKQLSYVGKGIQNLISFDELFKRIKNKTYMQVYINSNELPNDNAFNDSIKQLNALRNKFIHLSPDSWSIDFLIISDFVPNCLKIALFLLEESNNIISLDEGVRENISYKIKNKLLYEN